MREAIYATGDKIGGHGVVLGQGAQRVVPEATDTGYGAARFSVCPAGFRTCFGRIFPCCTSSCSVAIGVFTLCHCKLGVYNLFSEIIETPSLPSIS